MNPKEKAIKLVEKFKSLEIEVAAKYQGYGESCNYIKMQTFDAKDCALIAVDEILNYDIKAKSEPQFVIERRIQEYYEEVKQEIEKL